MAGAPSRRSDARQLARAADQERFVGQDRLRPSSHGRMNRLGIDLGGTKIAAVVLDDDGGVRLGDARADAARRLRRDDRRHRRAGRRRRSARSARVPVGIGMPGAISPATGLVKNANSTWLNGRPLQQDLERALGRRCGSPTTRTASRCPRRPTAPRPGARVVFGVILGTGIGGGIVVNGRVHRPARTRSPASGDTTRCRGRTTTSGPGPACYCGQSRLHRDVSLRARPGGRLRAARRRRRSRRGRSWRARGRRRSRCAAPSLDAWTARLAQVAGDRHQRRSIPTSSSSAAGCRASQRIYDDVPRAVGRAGCSPIASTRDFVPAQYGDASGVRGAAWLWGESRGRQGPQAAAS